MTSLARLAMASAFTLGVFSSTHSFSQAQYQSPQELPSAQVPNNMGMHPHRMGHERMTGMPGMMGNPKMQEQRDNRRAERQQKYLNELKVYLQLQAHQEAAWQIFSNAVKTPVKRAMSFKPSELEKLSTPERIDKVMASKAEKDLEITNRMNASKTFYTSLTPTQQKVFDTHTLKLLAHNPMGQHAKMHP